MKQLMVTSLLLVQALLSFNCGQNTRDAFPVNKISIDTLDVSLLEGMKVGEALSIIAEEYDTYIYVQEPPGNFMSCMFYYHGGKSLVFYNKELKHISRADPKGECDFEDYKQERISRAVLKLD